jgi:Pectate lyase superfamily protein
LKPNLAIILFTLSLLIFLTKCKIVKTNNHFGDIINIDEYGAIPNDNLDDSDAIQNAIDFAMLSNKSSHVYCPPGIYNIDEGLVIAKQKTDGNLSFVTLTFSGHIAANYLDQKMGSTTVFKMKNPTFGIAIQLARSCIIENIVFQGCANYTTDSKSIIDWKDDQWGAKSNAITNRYSPSCAISIDPFHNAVPVNERYLGQSKYYNNSVNGGSSMILIRGCSFFNHYIAISNNSSGVVQNGDNIRAENCHVSTCHTFWSCGQAQSRANSIENVYALFLHTFISGTEIGEKNGTPPTISNINIAGFCKQVMDIQTGFSGINYYRCYMESIWSLGISNGLSTSFDQCQIVFEDPNDKYFVSPFLLYATNVVAFRDCNLMYFSNCSVKAPMLFKSENLTLSGGTIEGGVVVADGYTNSGGDALHKVSFDNVKIKCLGKVAGIKTTEKPNVNLKDQIIMGGEVYLSAEGEMYVNSGATYDEYYLEEVNIKIDLLSKTASFVSVDSRKYKIGDNIFTLKDIDVNKAGFKLNTTIRSPLGYVSKIMKNTITLSAVPLGYNESKEKLFYIGYPLLKPEEVKNGHSQNKIKYYERK